MTIDLNDRISYCSIFETDSDRQARLCLSQLQSNPIPIWWYRRRIDAQNGKEDDAKSQDLSPFPKSWSLSYNQDTADEFRRDIGIGEDNEEDEKEETIGEIETDESSVYFTASQEKRCRHEQLRDEEGNCIKHPFVRLAKKNSTHKRRLSKIMFGKKRHRNSCESSSVSAPDTTWTVLLEECPECKLDSITRRRSQDKSSSKNKSRDAERSVTYEPFPATITVIESHPHVSSDSLALQIRTDPVPLELTRRLSGFLERQRDENNLWNTPDGALDFMWECDSDGNVLDNDSGMESTDCQFKIMERIIPLSSIDHISRGGDAWDVLRQSVGQEDLGCRCDLKVHGFSNRLLRFDVIGFGNHNSDENHALKLRQSFAVVDFFRSSMSRITENDQEDGGQSIEDQWKRGHYTVENIMVKLNDLVMWHREQRETGVEGWADCFITFIEEIFSLGVPSKGKKFIPVKKKSET
eukprot:scaffold65317_cov49-Cyclotella_meneghiniana.AAC.4